MISFIMNLAAPTDLNLYCNEDKGHDYLFYSEAAWAYREQLNKDYKAYVEDNGRNYCAEVKEEFMNKYLDKKQCFEPDPILMERIIKMFDTYCVK